MSRPFRTLIRVRYGECDAQQVVFNARYGDFVDLAVTEYIRILFGSYQEVLAQGYDYQVVHLSFDFKSPARFDDVVSISVEPDKMGNTSFSFLLECREFYSDRLLTTAEIVYVMVNCPNYEKISIPDFFRTKLTEGAPDQVSNYAGIDL